MTQINSNMSDQKKSSSQVPTKEKKPNETAGIQISTHVKIFDPNTKQVLVQKRGDI